MMPITRAERRQHLLQAGYVFVIGSLAVGMGGPWRARLELRWWEAGMSTIAGVLLIFGGCMGLLRVAIAPRHPTEEWKREQAREAEHEGGK